MRIGFLFNHDQIHQIAHSLPIAITLAKADQALDIVVATTNPLLRGEVERILALLNARGSVRLIDLRQNNLLIRGAVRVLDGIIPAAKLAIYRDNLEFFRSLDALVVAEKTSTILRSRYGLTDLKLIHTRHGAGDRAVGFNKASAQFDFVLVSGPKIRDRLVHETTLSKDRLAITGYPKFDLPSTRALPSRLCEGRPTILYNPHVSPHLSSWFRHGRAVLDFFVNNPQYNLIFAPHVMLFERKVVISIDKKRIERPGALDSKYWTASNIHIDLGSQASTDMSYTEAADIYLGDVSSQIYEFLLRPRPCIFLNSHHAQFDGDPNYAHWAAGAVIADPSELEQALASAFASHPRYLPIQRRLFSRSIDLNGRPSSERAAEAIAGFLGIDLGQAISRAEKAGGRVAA